MDVKLSSFTGEIIDKFTMTDGQECNLQDYLKSVDVSSSQYYLYLQTSTKIKTSWKINGKEPGDISVKYTQACESSYSQDFVNKSCYSVNDCYQQTTTQNPDIERDSYNPLENGFKITQITLRQLTYLKQSDKGPNLFEYPCAMPNSSGVLHTPDLIIGLENSKSRQLLMGVVFKEHNSCAFFQWYRNGDCYISGNDLCVVSVTEPGEYVVSVCDRGTIYQ